MMSQAIQYDQLLMKKDPDSMVSYKGPITPGIIATISAQLRDTEPELDQVRHRLFSIFMELAQNMQYYSDEVICYAEVEERIGWIQILEKQDHYEVNCGNALQQEMVSQLMEHCKTVNSLDKEELRRLKRERRKTPLDKNQKGAGLGLIQVAILAGNPLEVRTLQFGKQYSCILLKITINK